jgi:S-(hydroxymethyl)glutathione dehydrogenase/alcohol dehydrogenase
VLHWRPGAGIQARPASYRLGSRVVNAGYVTTFQQYTVVSENRLTPIPQHVDFEVAALLADTLTTGFGAVTRDARVEIGEAVAVIGVGGIGLGTLLGARLAGAHPIIGVDLYDHKLAKAKEYGATHTVNSTQEDAAAAILRINGGPVDAIFDGTGNPAVIGQAWRAVGPRGRLVLVGVMRHDAQFALNTLPLHFGKALTGSEGGSSRPDEDIPRLLRMIDDGRFDPRAMITHRCRLDGINDAIGCMRSGTAVHTIIGF